MSKIYQSEWQLYNWLIFLERYWRTDVRMAVPTFAVKLSASWSHCEFVIYRPIDVEEYK